MNAEIGGPASIGCQRRSLDRGYPETMSPDRPILGLLLLDTQFPRPIGDVGHPATFSFLVRPRVVPGAAPQRIVRHAQTHADAQALAAFVDAGQALVHDGVAAITTSCGFLARWQRELQAALPVPVWTSSLLALADELRGQRCGVITIEAAALTHEHFDGVGADPATPVEGITPGSALHRTLLDNLPTLDAADARAQVLAAAQRLLAREPGLQALLLECTNLPPYAGALREATGLPVHDIVTVLNRRMSALRA
jgi:Asp/Glu/hydantoin racemase